MANKMWSAIREGKKRKSVRTHVQSDDRVRILVQIRILLAPANSHGRNENNVFINEYISYLKVSVKNCHLTVLRRKTGQFEDYRWNLYERIKERNWSMATDREQQQHRMVGLSFLPVSTIIASEQSPLCGLARLFPLPPLSLSISLFSHYFSTNWHVKISV